MDSVLAGVILAILAAPILILFVLVALAHLAPRPSGIARATFVCPLRRRRVNAAFLTAPGSDRPLDVTACSEFADPGQVTCKKACLDVATTRWEPSAMTPPYSLIADGAAMREVSAPMGSGATEKR